MIRVLRVLLWGGVLFCGVGCGRTITVEVEGTSREDEPLRFGQLVVGRVDEVPQPGPDGLTALKVKVADEFVIPPGACGYVVGNAAFIRAGGEYEPTQSFIPHCEDAISLDGVFEGFFEELERTSGPGFTEQVRRSVEPHATMLQLPLPKPPEPGSTPETAPRPETAPEPETEAPESD